MGRSRTSQILLALATLAFVACNDKFMAQSARSKTSALAAISTTVDEAGNISGTIDPSASATQLLKFSSGELAGSAIAIPPGALSIPVSVTVGAGESLSSSQFLQDVGITNNSISAAGPSVAFTPSQPVEATNPFTLSIPFSSGSSLSLTTSNDNIVVLYRWTKVVNGESSHSMGIIPAKDVVIAKDKVSFQTTKFGVFQIGRAETKIPERVNVQSVQPPAPKRDLSNPLIGAWSACQSGFDNGGRFKEPTFVKPTWTSLNVDPEQINFGVRGKLESMKILRFETKDCSGESSKGFEVKGYSANAEASLDPMYFAITDSNGNRSDSCQAVYPVVRRAKDSSEVAVDTKAQDGVTDSAAGTNQTSVSSSGTLVAPAATRSRIEPFRESPDISPEFTQYMAGSRWISLSWESSGTVQLIQFFGLNCTGASKVVWTPEASRGRGFNRGDVGDLRPNSNYSFILSSDSGKSACQNVMTTSGDATDWTSGNRLPWNNGDAVFEFKAEVYDKNQYKLGVSINGLPPVDTYSTQIAVGVDSAVVKIPAEDIENSLVSAWTPDGCSFIGSDGRSFSAFNLINERVFDPPRIVCDGMMSQDSGGGLFGGYTGMKQMSKALNLKITNGGFTMVEDLFESPNCSAGTRISSKIEFGALVLPGTDFVKETVPIDVTSKDISGAIFTDLGIRAANKINPEMFGCGISSWVKGQRQGLAGSNCAQDIGRTKYKRLKITDDRLYICELEGEKDSFGMTPDRRIPSCEINERSFFFKRQ